MPTPMKKRSEPTGRWQDKPFYLTPMYKYALGEIITQHKQLSPKVKHTARAILAEFHTDGKIPRNLEALARDKCGISIRTFREHRSILEDAGLFRFDTPPYWKRNQADFAVATTICFPTKRAQKWLRDNGFLEATGKRDRWIEKSACAATTSQKPVANGTGLNQEVAAPAADAYASATARPWLATAESGSERTKGANFWDADTDETFWVAATQNPPDSLDAEYELGATVVNNEDMTGKIVGFPSADAGERLDGHVLVRYEALGNVIADWTPVTGITVVESPAATTNSAKPTAKPAAIGARVTGRVFKGAGTVVGHSKVGDTYGDVLVRPDNTPSVKITCWSHELVPVSRVEVEFEPQQEQESDVANSPVPSRTPKAVAGRPD